MKSVPSSFNQIISLLIKKIVQFIIILTGIINNNGVHSQHLIINGFEIEINEVPYQVSLQRNGSHFCGGSIINNKYVLTAAHCVVGRQSSEITIKAGINYLNNSGASYEAAQTFSISEIIHHPSYNSQNLDYDVALLKINGNFQYNNFVQPVDIITSETNFSQNIGNEVRVSGWGKTEDRLFPSHLKAVDVSIISNEQAINLSTPSTEITERMFATYIENGAGACDRDSGGPLVYKSEGFKDIQIGIVSKGGQAVCERGPTMYAKLSQMNQWVNTNAWNSIISGDRFVCFDNTNTYSVIDRPPYLNIQSWQVSNDIQIISQNENSVMVKPKNQSSNSRNGWIKAFLTDGRVLIKNLNIGLPITSSMQLKTIKNNFELYTRSWQEIILIGAEDHSDIEWRVPNTLVKTFNDARRLLIQPLGFGSVRIEARLSNECGTSPWIFQDFTIVGKGDDDLTDLLK